MEEQHEGHLADATRRWIKEQADQHYGGDWGRAAAAILEAAHARASSPDRWAELETQVRSRDPR